MKRLFRKLLRAWFAGLAMQGLVRCVESKDTVKPYTNHLWSSRKIAVKAHQIADEMMLYHE